MENENISLIKLSEDNFLINFIKININIEINDFIPITNKLWKCFLNNDGSMTVNLSILFEQNITLNLEYEKTFKINLNLEETNLLDILQNLANSKLETTDSYIIRKIKFFNNNNIVMLGYSIWDLKNYNEIYSLEEDHKKPLGLLIREKQIEYFKYTTNKFIKKESQSGYILLRTSVYKIKSKIAFILLEIFDSETYKDLIGQL